MYAQHVPIIAGAMRADYVTFKRGVMFAILSARVQFNRVPDQVTDLEKQGAKSRSLWNWKLGAYLYLEENGPTLWHNACAAQSPAEFIKALCKIPGLGIVKGAFVAQLMGHDTACLDARNIQREDLNPRAFRTDGIKSGPAFERKVEKYCAETKGRAEELWDTWCNEVGPDYGMTGDQCSKLHLDTIVPKRLRTSWHKITAPEIPF